MEQQKTFTFPFKLYEMIEHAHGSGFTSALSWLSSGNSFFIQDKNVMMNDLAPMFFKQTKYRSFTRQLYIWGFEQIDPYCWQHKYFVRGRPDLLEKIVRIDVKSSVKVKMVSPVPTSSSSNSNTNTKAKATHEKSKCIKEVVTDESNSRALARADSQASQFSESNSCEDEPFNNDELMCLAEIFDDKNKDEGDYPSQSHD